MHCHHSHHHAPCHHEGCKTCELHDDCKKYNVCQGHLQGKQHMDCPYHGCEACQRHADCEYKDICQHREESSCPYHKDKEVRSG